MSTSERVAVVTGGTAGVGRATVRKLTAEGFDVAVLARGAAGLDATVSEIEAAGRQGLSVPTDVADADAVNAAATRIEAELGPISVWINNAFVGALAFSWDLEPEEFRRIVDVTFYGQVHGTMAALTHMRRRDSGVIVNVSSTLAYRSIPLQSAYCSAKAATRAFTESIATELLATDSKVRIGLVTLPAVNTPQFSWNLNKMPEHPMPVPPIFSSTTCANAIFAATENTRRNRLVGTSTAYTMLGNMLVPGLLDRYLGHSGLDAQQSEDAAVRYGSNLFEPQDETQDRGADGEFGDDTQSWDPVSLVETAADGVRRAARPLQRVLRLG